MEATQATPDTSGQNIDEALSDIAKMSVAATVADEKEEVARDETGKFAAKADDSEIESVEDKPAVEKTASELDEEAKAEAKPADDDSPVVVPAVEGRELHTKFRVLSKEGDEYDIPDVMIEMTANKKTRLEPLDKVVKMAEWGIYNHEREQQATQALSRVKEVEAQSQEVLAYARGLEAHRDRLLADPDLYMEELAAYEAKNTPEARLQAVEQERQQEQQAQEFRTISQTGEQFFESEVAPAVETIIKALPTVSGEEIGAKLLLITDRFRVNTQFGQIVPPSAYDAVRQAVVEELVPWAQQVHDSRDSERKQSKSTAEAEKRTLQVEAQKAKNLSGRIQKPVAGRVGRETPQAKPIRTIEDAHESAVASTLAAMGMR